ncbi:hypothetical protein L0U85_08395 [Glycomyces sp. L485]|uniref:hypothetical protein n=1 Tax=Glycomyces sp. L485 TaxID=2909235 RepID=UPI001F4AD8B1|nr:hypothetical protein [Glycomyces sp. L485]MCH7230868.1 hypothetical protein [Glycomyces sp. L485]
MDTPKPIGYWLKHLDNLLELQFQASLEDLALNRRHWQVLNVLYGGARSAEELGQALSPFWDEDGPDLETILHGEDGLSPRGWIRRSAILIGLSNDGYDAYQKVAARIEEARETILDGLSAEQYAETIRVLSVMASNIERALRSPR